MSKVTGGRQPFSHPQNRLTARPNEIITRKPLMQASCQMQKGDPQSCSPKLRSILSWDGAPKMKPVPKNTPDITGKRSGSLVVKGLLDKSGFGNGNAKASWVVRCDCGMWETRTYKAITSGRETHDCCVHCRTVVQRKRELERRRFFALNGYWPDGSVGAGRTARS